MNPSDAITALLSEMDHGNPDAISELMPLIYAQLRQIAASHVNRERRGHTLQASDLLQEACLRVVKPNTGPWKSRHHFLQSRRDRCAKFWWTMPARMAQEAARCAPA
jgi:DNA-directed RNA polymerase specialized sigma24 family protein